MKERGILFTPENYTKCENGTKTQTRRIMKQQPCGFGPIGGLQFKRGNGVYDCKGGKPLFDLCPFGTVGDRLYVKESIYIDHFDYLNGPLPKTKPDLEDGMLIYRRDGTCCEQFAECACATEGKPKWRSPLFMPKWAARLWLEITEVRVERLHDISEADAIAEGVQEMTGQFAGVFTCGPAMSGTTAKECFRRLWESNKIHKPGSWELNPWVWILEFKKVNP